MKPPVSLSDEELSKYADEHLAYELDMLRWSASVLYSYNIASLRGSPLEGPLSQPISNALIESFAIHTRNLIDFLFLRNHYHNDRSSDIIVEDYLDLDKLPTALPPITELLENAKRKADKQIAHLASQRLRYGIMDKSWFYTEILKDIHTAFTSVVSFIPESRAGRHLALLLAPEHPYFIPVSGQHIATNDGSIKGISFILDNA